ncbi:MAG TPA: iron-containing alcohol dehydrogenase [Polyangiaceae bacterium]|nr:iron-containing alcohol dehydrogenase [Polyangiaceae bacterium]
MQFELATAARVIFGAGSARSLGALAAEFGERALVVTGKRPERVAPQIDAIKASGLAAEIFPIGREPTLDDAREGVRRAEAHRADVIIGIGGGSPLDAGKAIAMLVRNGGDPLDSIEVIGRGKPILEPSLPYIAVPTTAGPGAEVAKNAVLRSPEHGIKASLRSPLMLPRVALVDPLLTHGMPPEVTAATGLDALTQVLEAFVSNAASPLTDPYCRDGLGRASRALRVAYRDGSNAAAREDMALVSLFGGLALANAKLGAVHGLAGPIGGVCEAPHGAVCARLLAPVIATNVSALRSRDPASPALARFAEAARLLTGSAVASVEDGVAWIRDLCADLAVPDLRAYGLREADIPSIVAAAQRSSSMKGNPLPLTDAELLAVMERSY